MWNVTNIFHVLQQKSFLSRSLAIIIQLATLMCIFTHLVNQQPEISRLFEIQASDDSHAQQDQQEFNDPPDRGIPYPPDELLPLDIESIKRKAKEELKQRDPNTILDLKAACLNTKMPLTVRLACWEYYVNKHIFSGMSLADVLADGIVQPEWIGKPLNLMVGSTGPPKGMNSRSGEFATLEICPIQKNNPCQSRMVLVFRLSDIQNWNSVHDSIMHHKQGKELEALVIIRATLLGSTP